MGCRGPRWWGTTITDKGASYNADNPRENSHEARFPPTAADFVASIIRLSMARWIVPGNTDALWRISSGIPRNRAE